MSFSGQGEPETVSYFDTAYPNVSTTFYPNFTHENLQLIMPLVDKLWSGIAFFLANHTPDLNPILGLVRRFSGIRFGKREEFEASLRDGIEGA